MSATVPPPSRTRMLARGLARRCARCGHGRLFRRWFRMAERCPSCGLRFERESGFFVGALFVNFAVTEVVMVAWIIAAFAVTLPDPPTAVIALGAVAVAIVVPLVCYPFSKTVWTAVHLTMQPLDPDEEADIAAWRFERGDALR